MLEGTNNFVANKCDGDGAIATAANRLHPFLTSLDPLPDNNSSTNSTDTEPNNNNNDDQQDNSDNSDS